MTEPRKRLIGYQTDDRQPGDDDLHDARPVYADEPADEDFRDSEPREHRQRPI